MSMSPSVLPAAGVLEAGNSASRPQLPGQRSSTPASTGYDRRPAPATPPIAVISIIVPTRNEAANVDSLVRRIDNAMAGTGYEVLIVDDGSTDGTAQRCKQLSECYPIRVFSRDRPAGGLSGAVLHGFAMARGRILVAMDGDLQHPPEALPALVSPLLDGRADFVLGSRYAPGGTVARGWRMPRRAMSRVARMLCRPLSGTLADPMSGFFALPRGVFEAARGLDPIGYKIALEVLCKCEVARVAEIPISFDVREHGCSKMSLSQQRDYLRHLWRLYRHRYLGPPRCPLRQRPA